MSETSYMIKIPETFRVKCHEPLCDKHAHLYRYPEQGNEKDTLAVLSCPECAAKHGFCKSCGAFVGGLESFEFGNQHGYCDQCWENMEPVDQDYDYEDEF